MSTAEDVVRRDLRCEGLGGNAHCPRFKRLVKMRRAWLSGEVLSRPACGSRANNSSRNVALATTKGERGRSHKFSGTGPDRAGRDSNAVSK